MTGFPPSDPADVDASLPLDFEHRSPRPPLLGTAAPIRLEKIGEDIVNSISIHKLPDEDGVEGDVVAVLTNNDKTVRLYSLTQNLEVTVIDLPFAMNHATISPDGKMMVAVGDAPIGFFFERTKTQKSNSSKTLEGGLQSGRPEWQSFEEVSLYRPDSAHADGYFTTAWSPSGRLCALGSECGYISVFDIDLLKIVEYGENAIVRLISSTRPDTVTGAGAVRTMYFSPAPWDFLVWSEDQARVCVADLRSGLKVKQVLTLDPREEGIERVEIANFDLTLSPEMHELRREADFLRGYRRALDSEGTAVAVNVANTYFEADSERYRSHRRLGVVESDNDPHGLTAHERQVLETLRSTRQREEGREQGVTPRSINYTTSGQRGALPYVHFLHTRNPQLTDCSEPTRREMAAAMTEYMLDTSRHRPLHERTFPRRQASVIVSIDEATINVPPGTHTHITDSALTRSPNSVPAHARRITNEIITSTDEAWRTIEEALATQARAANRNATSNPANGAATASNPTAPELRSELRRLRQLTQMRERLRNARASQPSTETYEFSLGLRRPSRSHNPEYGLRTAGLAMSQDGRTLYCGTEEGIFEFKMNLHVRKAFPAITPR